MEIPYESDLEVFFHVLEFFSQRILVKAFISSLFDSLSININSADLDEKLNEINIIFITVRIELDIEKANLL